ncbi:MAG: protein translocase subunit SecD [Planctomycetes bacterium]|nr:protein translocase subunit SecD [Planctomycetota bacterium]
MLRLPAWRDRARPTVMLENARRQLFLVLLALLAGLACVLTLKPALGSDLKGGTQLRYEVPGDVLQQLVAKENVSIDAIMAQTIGVIIERIDPTGTLDPLVTRSGETGILIELPYFDDPLDLKRVEERIANLGKLEFRIVADNDYAEGPVKFNLQVEKARLEAWLRTGENRQDLLANLSTIRRFNEDPTQGPMQFGHLAWYPRLIKPRAEDPKLWDTSYTNIGLLAPATAKVYTDAEWNNGVVPESVQKLPPNKQFLVELLALNMHTRHFTGEHLDPVGVQPTTSSDGGLAVAYSIVGALTSDYADWSERWIGKCSAIVLNGVVKSAPRFESKIPGRGQIHGDFTKAEVEELVKVLRTGSLRVEPEQQSKLIIGPTLGRESIARGVWSLVAGSLLVFAFMLVYYRIAGTIACVTLLLNGFLLYAAMLFMQATLTLPGLGGIVLTMGMAVDANVLIYERIREELTKGKDLLRAVRAGFERAMSAILDSNITTFLVGIVLFNVGVGPVRGFAVTLMVGIVTTVFTQFFVTRLLFHYALENKWLTEYRPRQLLTNLNLDFVKHIGKCVALSSVVILAGLAYAFLAVPREVMLGTDFTGGANLRMVVSEPMTADEVRGRLTGDEQFRRDYPNATVNTVGAADPGGRVTEFNVRLKLTDAQREAIEASRHAWSDQRQAAQREGSEPPLAYEPPYVLQLRRVFGDRLVQPAFTGALTVPSADGNKNLEFAQVDLHFGSPVSVIEATSELATRLKGSKVSVVGADAGATVAKDLRVEWTTQASTRDWELFEIVRGALGDLKDAAGQPIKLSDPFPEAQEIQGRLVDELRNAAIGALVLAWVLIVLYLRVRFHEYKYGVAAVVALVHDVLVAFGAVVLVNHLGLVHAEINLAMIACFLTIIGYSVNDTIVIFDRIRENVADNARLGTSEPFRVLINRALNQTMSRTLLTTGLTLLVVLAQFLVNRGSGTDLESFAFAMIVGMISGVYSTVYIAAPILIWMHKPGVPAAPVAPAVAAPVEGGAAAP